MHRRSFAFATVIAAGLTAVATGGGAVAAPSSRHTAAAKHVLLLSVDGLHQTDLAYYVTAHPHSALARLVYGGADYTRAKTTFPSDSFPGMVAQLTGGGAGTTGVYYDDTYNPALLPPGTTDCSTAARGTEVSWTEAADRSQNPITLDAGQGLDQPALKALPTNTRSQTLANSSAITKAILTMTPTPQSLLDPAALPVSPATCLPVYPHNYLRTNTVFNVARRSRPAHGLVGQARGLRDPFRPLRDGHPGPVHPGDQQCRRQKRRRLDDRQRAHPRVRQHQGRGGAQPDRRAQPLGSPARRHPGDLRDELPGAVHSAEAPDLRGHAGRLQPRRHAGSACCQCFGLCRQLRWR